MPPRIHIIRHAQGEHNINDAHHLRDPLLTAIGKHQCQDLAETFPFHNDISIILASPLKRTIQTAAYVFSSTLEKRQIPLLLAPMAQEISHLPCDLGYEREIVLEEGPKLVTQAAPGYDVAKLDMSLVGDDWNAKKGIYAATVSAVRQRAFQLRAWLYQRPEKHVALVSHGGFLHYLIEDWSSYDISRGTGFSNCEWRQYEFTRDSNGREAHLTESGSTREKQDMPAGVDAHIIHEIEGVEKVRCVGLVV
ncbi:hypothetical protein ASPWEDRAFT_168061 [Aspergillus wentii DTO 134E9]|uniref:Phosphoglycerate mutase-like protein n=1 Tax=Aspergillus wentii DTO 134E9 TaxID=1073089 RepID=A0A1L9RT46_ASPWE|nr:uncharacterized protein ASPWEDRAFT_168061 [Aspergillus wentii DTO 134E9]KAI9933786.1 hypothetical protein MW887_004858 [Aspergillus wentii]OJJ38131.1 hypothetical protein ASPWEDRAFT_168061 [Aspergillus wentii DTO 134E9]